MNNYMCVYVYIYIYMLRVLSRACSEPPDGERVGSTRCGSRILIVIIIIMIIIVVINNT